MGDFLCEGRRGQGGSKWTRGQGGPEGGQGGDKGDPRGQGDKGDLREDEEGTREIREDKGDPEG